jgi:hypothetical protein
MLIHNRDMWKIGEKMSYKMRPKVGGNMEKVD